MDEVLLVASFMNLLKAIGTSTAFILNLRKNYMLQNNKHPTRCVLPAFIFLGMDIVFDKECTEARVE